MASSPQSPAADPFAALTEYEARNLVAHLDAAGNAAAVHRVLEMSTGTGRNAWYEAQLRLGDAAGYLADVARAWARAETASGEQAAAKQRCTGIDRHVRYALITVTLNSHAQDLPAGLLAATLARGVWSGRRALAFVGQIRDPAARAEALVAISPHLVEPLLTQALEQMVAALRAAASEETLKSDVFAGLPENLPGRVLDHAGAIARTLADPGDRALAMHHVARRAGEPARGALLQEALATARGIAARSTRIDVIAALVSDLAEPLRSEAVREALSAIRAKPGGGAADGREEALVALAPFLSEEQIGQAMTTAWALAKRDSRIRVRAALARRMPPALLEKTIDKARAIKSKAERLATLAELARHLPEPLATGILEEALATARALPAHLGRGTALVAVATGLPQSRRGPAVDDALASLTAEASFSNEDLIALAPCLSESQLRTALGLARTIDTPELKAQALSALIAAAPPRRRGPIVTSMLAAARAIDWPLFRVEAFAGVMPYVANSHRERVAGEALGHARSIDDTWFRSKALAALAPHLSSAQLLDAIEASQSLGDGGPRSLLLVELALCGGQPPAEDTMEQALAVAGARHNFADRVQVIVELAPHLTASLREEALRAVTTSDPVVDSGVDRAKASVLEALAPYLGPDQLGAALELSRSIGYLEERAGSLAAMAPHLPESLLGAAIAAAREIGPGAHANGRQGGGRHHGAEALAALSARVEEPTRSALVRDAVAIARAIQWPRERALTIGTMIPLLSGALQAQLFAELFDGLSEDGGTLNPEVAGMLSSLAPLLPGPLQARAVDTTLSIADLAPRAATLAALAAQLDGALRTKALTQAAEAARGITEAYVKVPTLVRVAERVEGSARDALLEEARAAAEAIDFAWLFADSALVDVMAHTSREEGARLLERALTEARSAADGRTKVARLVRLASLVPVADRAGVLREAVSATRRLRDTTDPDRTVPVDLTSASALPRPAMHDLWAWSLHELVAERRPFFLQHFVALMPLLRDLGGEEAVNDTRDAVLAVTHWWP